MDRVIRVFDILLGLSILLVISPLFLLLVVWIKFRDKDGPVFYQQTRVGLNGVDFSLLKFRTMRVGADKSGLITIGDKDSRVSRFGFYLRKYKLDELPQLINVLRGEMSLVGPRPEVRKYVNLYTPHQLRVLDVKPGITDYASIEYMDENEILAASSEPDRTYVEEIMPAKIVLNMKFVDNRTLTEYFRILWITFAKLSGRIWNNIIRK